MPASEETRAMPAIGRILVAVALIAFTVVQAKVLLEPDGIYARHGFWDGFDVFNQIMMSDPVTVAGLIDLATMMVFLIVILGNGIPRGRYYWPILIVSILAALVYPGFIALGFLLLYWRRLGQFRP